MTNPYLETGTDQLSAPVRKKLERAADRIFREEKAAREQEAEQMLDRLYKRWRQKRRQAFEAAHPESKALRAFLRKMDLSSAPGLIALVRGAEWLLAASDDDRWFALNMIGHAMVRVRVKHDLPEFDDPLPGEPPKAFETIRELLRVR
jgi:hypothetical protein